MKSFDEKLHKLKLTYKVTKIYTYNLFLLQCYLSIFLIKKLDTY